MVQQAEAPVADPVAAVPVVEATPPSDPVEVAPAEQLPPQTPAAQVTAPEATPATPAPTTQPWQDTLPPEAQEYVSRIEQEARSAREQNDLNVLTQTVAQYAPRLEQQYGLSPEQSQPIAKLIGDILYNQYQADQVRPAQRRAAIAIGKQFGVDPMQLVDLPSPQAMTQAARTLSETTRQSQENAQLRARVAALEKGRVPAQNFAGGAQPGAGAGLTGDALEAAWLKHETTQPDRPNPYDSAYRAMLRG